MIENRKYITTKQLEKKNNGGLTNNAKQAIRWYFNNNHPCLTVKEARQIMTETWGDEVMQEIKEWAKQ
jgi:hypothetical protein